MRITTVAVIILTTMKLFSICKDNKKDANHNSGSITGQNATVVFDMQR